MPREPLPRRSFQYAKPRKTVEISYEEYTHNKNEILSKIYRRLFWLACLATAFGLIALVLYIIITSKYANAVEYRRPVMGVALKSVYMIYWGACAAVAAHGFHLHLKWRHFLEDGTHLVMHCRLFEVLGLWWFFSAGWLLGGILAAFGFIDLSVISANVPNIMYAVAVVTLVLQFILCPWFLKTIHSKTTQIDDILGSEFLGKTRFRNVNVEPLTDLNDIPSGRDDGSDEDKENSNKEEESEQEEESSEEEVRGPATVMFALDPKHKIKKSDFWELWKSTSVAGSFSCNFRNKPPTLADVTKHLNAQGFHVVSSNSSNDVVEIFLYGHAVESSVPFLAEFIFVYPRQFFQTTFKCESKERAADFVKEFQLHQLMDTVD
ncbi:unnamed protein product [Aphanomyces euteiches]|uniref:Beta-adaptin appendage C-terminal subdomain domain-containing protein n=1 Tax=Aphanomyces euteiches TaxID=100861 RepID=A0A6G0XB38_9STRA|nr:hypothetical protein Ae201684_006543 [Aphanomyces euteiches]KAH9090954.1 hypothetical protein Ae201684P_006357 [Aphanomyces euteiches]KAH9157595.1 hypothetical protein AeRB84_000594 [Aphanomyces euteiches]